MKKKIIALVTLLVVAVLFASAWFFFTHRSKEMDPRLLQYSGAGLPALSAYLRGDYRNAAGRYREYFAQREPALLSENDESRQLFVTGDLTNAYASVQKRLADNPQDPELQLTHAEIEVARNNLERTDEIIAAMLADQTRRFRDEPERYLPQHEAWLIKTAIDARRSNYASALSALRTYLREARPPKRFTLTLTMMEVLGEVETNAGEQWALRAHLHQYLASFDSRHYAQAAQCARRAITMLRDVDEAFVVLAVAQEKTGEVDAALDTLRKAIERNPKNAEAALRAARLANARGEAAHVQEYLLQAQAAAPTERRYLDALLTHWFAKLEYARALEVVTTFLAARPDDEQGLYWAGQVQAAMGDLKRSNEFYFKAVEPDPEDARLRELIARNLYRLGSVDGAVISYKRAISIDAKRVSALQGLADLYLEQKRYLEAIETYRTAFQLTTPPAAELAKLCGAYQAAEMVQEAAECTQRAQAAAAVNTAAKLEAPRSVRQ